MKFIYMMLTCLAFSFSPARAAVFACPGLAGLKEEAKSCKDNASFGQAGLDCLKNLEKAIQARAAAAQKEMAASNALKVDKAGNAQTHNFQGATADYSISQDALSELIANAKVAHVSVHGYLNNIIYPEDFDAPEDIIGDMIEFLDANPCYNDNRLGLEGVKKKIESHIKELEVAKLASLGRGTTSGNRNSNQGSIIATKNQGGNTGNGSVMPVPQGTSRNPASSITGVEDDAKKRAKAH